MPSVGEKSLRMTASRVAALIGPPRNRYAVVSVIDAPPPSNCRVANVSLRVLPLAAGSPLASETGSDWVEVADNLPGVVGVRDSKDPHGPALTFAPGAWSAFVTGIGQPRG